MSLVLAGVCFAAALAFSAGGWRALLPDGVSVVQACARFGCGSLANTVLPLHGGNVLRINLFGRIVPGGMLAVAGAVAVFSTARWLTLLPLAGTALPPEALLVPAAGLATAVVLARRHRASPWMYAQSLVFAAGSLGARIVGVMLVTGSLSAALLVVPALELAGTISVTPANIGIAEGAAAVALHAHGLPMGRAMTTAIVLHAVETAGSVAFGGAGAGILLRRSPLLHRFVTIRPTWRHCG
ncbi:MAG: hypothetical protein E6F98_00815 [Actinobacteria bacterium]|nr:MAG: hypothetical protein E6F98_00815 [Actinomycetota bacterium]